jgi:hypothetical protein
MSESISTSISESLSLSESATIPGDDAPTTPAGDGPAAPTVVVPAPGPAATAPAPVAPTPAAVTAPVAPVVTVPDDEVPLAVLDVEDELQRLAEQIAGEDGLTSIEDEETPLANMNLTASVKHCILHFIELILAAILGGAYVGSTRKQKKEIAEIKKKLEDEER